MSKKSRKTPPSRTIQDSLSEPVNQVARNERAAQRRFSSGQAGITWQSFRLLQSLMIGVLVNPFIQPGRQSVGQQALLAIASYCFRLSRAADLVVTSGYPIQAVSLVRGIYERISIALRVRGDEKLALRLLEEGLKASDVGNYVSDWKDDIVPLIRQYLMLHPGGDAAQGFDLDGFTGDVGRLYGTLSGFAHPGKEALRTHFAYQPEGSKALFAIQPDEDAKPHAEVLLGLLCVLLYVICVMLVLDFRLDSDQMWLSLVIELDRWTAEFARQVPHINSLHAGGQGPLEDVQPL